MYKYAGRLDAAPGKGLGLREEISTSQPRDACNELQTVPAQMLEVSNNNLAILFSQSDKTSQMHKQRNNSKTIWTQWQTNLANLCRDQESNEVWRFEVWEWLGPATRPATARDLGYTNRLTYLHPELDKSRSKDSKAIIKRFTKMFEFDIVWYSLIYVDNCLMHDLSQCASDPHTATFMRVRSDRNPIGRRTPGSVGHVKYEKARKTGQNMEKPWKKNEKPQKSSKYRWEIYKIL